MIRLSLLLCVLVPAASWADSADEPAVELNIKTLSHARHEGSAGKALIELTSRQDQARLFSEEREGQWVLLGFNAKTKDYVLGGLFEIGAWLPIREIQYLSTGAKPRLRPARIDKDDNWYALGTQTSPDGRFIAFVGRDKRHPELSLFVLDTTRDQHSYLGKPPHAAPAQPAEVPAGSEEQFWDWGGGCCDGHFVMDQRAVWFESPTVLKVDYGFDPGKKPGAPQAKKVRTWSLPLASKTKQ